jgi:uncharacterized protein YkwD
VSVVDEVMALTNKERRQAGCPPLSRHPTLARVAQQYSQQMAQDDFFSHTGPDGSTPADRARAAGYDFRRIGENIAAGYSTPKEVVASWMESQTHRENILNCAFQETGVGHVYLDPDPGQAQWHHYWTQILGAQQ